MARQAKVTMNTEARDQILIALVTSLRHCNTKEAIRGHREAVSALNMRGVLSDSAFHEIDLLAAKKIDALDDKAKEEAAQ